MTHLEYPRLRPLEPMAVQVQGRAMMLLRDPLRLCSGELCIAMEAAFLLQLLDGNHSLRDIKAHLARQTGSLLVSDQIEHLVTQLDAFALLDNQTFQQTFRQVSEQFAAELHREAFHAGTAYPAHPAELNELLDGFYARIHEPSSLPAVQSGTVQGLVVPHIDVRAGGIVFARGYDALRQSHAMPETFVILGTGHQGLRSGFACTRKAFVTPLGTVETDVDFVDALMEEMPVDLLGEELAHRTEHVIEFQTIFLQHLLSGRHSFKIVPILCSFEPELFFQGTHDGRAEVFNAVANRLAALIQEWKRPVCLIASADLDHVGPRYGDRFQPTEQDILQHLEEDRELLTLAAQGRDRDFLEWMLRANRRKKICGFPAIYTLMQALPGSRWEILALDHSIVDREGSFVSYGAAVLHR